MSDKDMVKQALAELGDIVRCLCDEAYISRGLHDPSCNCDSSEALATVKKHIRKLTEQLEATRADAKKAEAYAEELERVRQYASALEDELRARAERLDKLLLLANSMDVDFNAYVKAHPAALRITGPNRDGEYWLHVNVGGRSGGINLGVKHGPIVKRLLDAASETGAKE
jgi:hypothetical protein